MVQSHPSVINAVVVDETVHFDLDELSRACLVDSAWLIALVDEGVLQPEGRHPESWLFDGTSLARARTVLRLTRELGLDTAGAAVVMNLLEEIATLKARLRREGIA